MDQKHKSELASRLASLDSNERNKLLKRAALLRKSVRRPARTEPAALDDDDELMLPRRRPRASLHELALKLLEEEAEVDDGGGATPAEGPVIWLGRKACVVRTPAGDVRCDVSPDLARNQQTSLAIGDFAIVRSRGDSHTVSAVRPRRTRLSRPDPGNPHLERVLVANVDLVVVTVSVKTPPLHPRLIDRFVVAIQRGGAEAAVCVNKLDLLADPADRECELGKLDPYRAAGLEIVSCSAVGREGLSELRDLILGRTVAFVGHSGVGKSSILNALQPDLALETGSLSAGYGRGRHTTTASSLHDLGGGTRLIDTPGIRAFGIWRMSPVELAWYFPEFDAPSADCRFRNCTHVHEPECGVKQAVAAGGLSAHRYDTYVRLVNEA